MKHIFSITLTITALFFVSIFASPKAAHAQLLTNPYIQEKIADSKGNIYQNRDNRNKLLEEQKNAALIKPLTSEERQQILTQELSISFSNLENIRDRIQSGAIEAQNNGKDISTIEHILSDASTTLSQASTTISYLTTWNPQATSTLSIAAVSSSTIVFDPLKIATQAALNLNSVKDNLQQAVLALKLVM